MNRYYHKLEQYDHVTYEACENLFQGLSCDVDEHYQEVSSGDNLNMPVMQEVKITPIKTVVGIDWARQNPKQEMVTLDSKAIKKTIIADLLTLTSSLENIHWHVNQATEKLRVLAVKLEEEV